MFALCLPWIALAQAPTLLGENHAVRLNGELVHELAGDVLESRPSPGGAWIVYRARLDTATGVELFSAPADGGGPAVRLSDHPLDVGAFLVSPDDTRVVYTAGQELHSVPIDGSQAPALLASSALSFVLSPDSSRVAYFASSGRIDSAPIDGSSPAIHLATLQYPVLLKLAITPDSTTVVLLGRATRQDTDLLAVPIDGSAPPLQLDPPLPAGSDVAGFEIAPDSSAVVYRAEQDSLSLYELYAVSPAGGATTKLSASSASVTDIRITPDGSRVVYRAGLLFSVLLAGGTPLGISNTNVPSDFAITPDSKRVVFHDVLPRLHSAALDGSGTLLLTNSALEFQLSSDGARAVFRAGQPARLYSVPTLGGTVVRLDSAASLGVASFELDPDGDRVAMSCVRANPTDFELWGAPLDGATEAVLLSPPNAGGVRSFHARAGRAFFVGDVEPDPVYRLDQLYRAPLDGSEAPVRVNDDFPQDVVPLGDVYDYLISPRGERVLYSADQELDGDIAIYSVPSGGGLALKLGDPGPTIFPAPTRSITPIAFTPGGFALLYGWDGSGRELLRVPVEGGSPPQRLTGPTPYPDDVQTTILVTPSGERALYIEGARVWSLRTDGSAAPIQLTTPEIVGDGVEDSRENLKLSPDGAWVVFTADQQRDNHLDRYELFSAPADGSQAPRRLHPALTGGQVIHFDIAPDSTHVIFSARLGWTGPFELFSAPIDGSGGGGTPTRISLPMSGQRSVLALCNTSREEFQITTDSTRVVYLAGHVPDDSYELYAVPIGGGGGRRLNPRLVAGGDVLWGEPSASFASSAFRISPDGRRVVYEADQRVDGLRELFSVPLPDFTQRDLPLPRASVLSTAPGAQSVATHFELTPDGKTVVYSVDTDPSAQFVYELFRVSIEGGASVRLHPPLAQGQFSLQFALSPDGASVLYEIDSAYNELFLGPLDLSLPPRSVSGPIVGNVKGMTFGPGGQRIFYKADQNVRFAAELFSSSALLVRPAGPPKPLR